MSEITISMEFLSGVLGTPVGELSKALKKDDSDELKPQKEIEKFISTGITKKLKDAESAAHDEGHGRGTRESLSKKEKELKEKFSLKSKSIDEMFAEIQERKSESSGQNGQMTDEDVKASELYVKTVGDLQAQLKEKETEIQTIRDDQAKAELDSLIDSISEKVYVSEDAKSFVRPKTQEIAENLKRDYKDKFRNKVKWGRDKDGNAIPVDEKGKPLTDDYRNPISPEKLAFDVMSGMYETATSEQRDAPGIATQNGGGGNNNFAHVRTEADAQREFNRHRNDPEKLKELKTHVNKLAEDGVLAN